MVATLRSSLEVEDALLSAAEKLGMKTLLLRMVASGLPDNPWLSDLRFEREGRGAIAHATHLCGSACSVNAAGCLTAFKMEDAVTKRTGAVMIVESVEREGPDGIRVRLRAMDVA